MAAHAFNRGFLNGKLFPFSFQTYRIFLFSYLSMACVHISRFATASHYPLFSTHVHVSVTPLPPPLTFPAIPFEKSASALPFSQPLKNFFSPSFGPNKAPGPPSHDVCFPYRFRTRASFLFPASPFHFRKRSGQFRDLLPLPSKIPPFFLQRGRPPVSLPSRAV